MEYSSNPRKVYGKVEEHIGKFYGEINDEIFR